MRKANMYFFGVEQLHPSDAFWAYGVLGGASMLAFVVGLAGLFGH